MDHDKTDADESGTDASGTDESDTDATGTDIVSSGAASGQPEAGDGTPVEVNGPKGPEPTRYGDWEQKGRCSDF